MYIYCCVIFFFVKGQINTIYHTSCVLYERTQLDMHKKYLSMYYHGKFKMAAKCAKFLAIYFAEQASCDNKNSVYLNKIGKESNSNSFISNIT